MLRRRGWRCSAVALLLLVVVPGVTIARTLTITCERCLSSCPMHTRAKAKLRCHESTEHPARTCSRTPGIALPGCGFAGEMPLLSLPPAIPTARVASCPLRVTPAPAPDQLRMPGRSAAPPEPPPPITSA